MIRAAPTVLLLILLAFPANVQAQNPDRDLFGFLLSAPETVAELEPGGTHSFRMRLQDLSKDSTGGILPLEGAPNVSPQEHQVRFKYTLNGENPQGWFVLVPGVLYTKGGDDLEVRVTVGVSPLVQEVFMPITITAVAQANGYAYESSVNITAYTLGVSSFNVIAEDLGGEVRPGHVVDVQLRITNAGLRPRAFDISIVENQCGLTIASSNGNMVPPKETKVYTVSVRAPEAKLWYFSEICSLGIQVNPSQQSLAVRTVSVPVIVSGGYVNPVWVFWTLAIIAAIILLILLVGRRKARIEEEILGKPQKPWLIPVEALYLRALREKDERAWYVVRHHLMEEEYRSSLLWYAAYKKATKGSRKKEALVLRQEKAYERWKAAWQKDIAKPLVQADRFEAKLQRTLDRKARKLDRKDARRVRRITKKMAAAHGKQVERALEKWQKASRKAEKKGLAAPARPVLPEPDYPEEPDPRSLVLAEHKWARKGERFRARMVRRQGNLEVRFEKADARRLAKLRRKVQRLARKLDDPDFVAEHPLLNADGA